MDYTELVKDTDRLIQRVMLHQVIGELVLMIAVMVLMTILVIIAAETWHERRRTIQRRREETLEDLYEGR